MGISGTVSTGDPNLACALWTCGVPLDERRPVDKIKSDRGDYLRFNFLPVSLDGKQRAAALVAAWEAGEEHIRAFPDDGMSYCMAYSLNRKQLMDFIKSEIPQVMIRKGRQVALISENAPLPLQAEILGRLR